MTSSDYHIAGKEQQKSFEQQYISLRRKEGRIYTDDELLQLPHVADTHPLRKEWKVRQFSSENLIRYLEQKRRKLDMLEIGCGNGWLSAKLASLPGATVTGLDINDTELAQAKRVFKKPNLFFVSGNIRENCLDKQFDIIVFAASFQYFESIPEIVDCCLHYLSTGGEIHIIDTMFYAKAEADKAAERSFRYFTSAGFPSMQEFYFHHNMDGFLKYNYQLLFNPNSWRNRIFKQNPFPWICIKK